MITWTAAPWKLPLEPREQTYTRLSISSHTHSEEVTTQGLILGFKYLHFHYVDCYFVDNFLRPKF